MLTNNSKVYYLKINEENYDQRIDNFLYRLFNKQVARSLIYSLIRTGQVRVNSCRVKPSYHLEIDDNIRIPPIKIIPEELSADSIQNKKKPNKKLLDFWQEQINKAIIFENKNLLVINKPASLAVHGGSRVTIGLIEVLRNLRPKEHYLELVHRIDQDTSGCLMIAKKRSYLKKLQTLLREHKITKTYSALVVGALVKPKIVEVPLKKIIKSSKEHFVIPCTTGGYAKTEIIPDQLFKLKSSKGNNLYLSLLKVKPLTGKTHQIRVHLAHIGFPIINDDKYGCRERDSEVKYLGLNRMFLHAKSLKFVCPDTNNNINITAKYNSYLSDFLFKLRSLEQN